MTEVEIAERTVATLTDKRDRAALRVQQIAEERKAIGFAVHVHGDSKARTKLDKLNVEGATIAGELESVNAALAEAQSRLEAARLAEARKADKRAALALRKSFARFVALSEQMDQVLGAVVTISAEMNAAIAEIHACGHGAPSGQQWLSYGERAMHTQLVRTPWARSFQPLGHNERRTFAALAHDWQAGALRSIEQRLGEQKESADAA
jgi:hypothetical protein